MEVTVIGDVNPDLLYITDSFPALNSQSIAKSFQMKLGGSAANTAYALAKLGAKVHFYGAVGKDLLGKFCESELKRAGVQAHLKKVEAPTGATSAVEFKGTRTMFSYRGANEFLDITHVDLRGNWMHVSGYWHLTALRKDITRLYRDAKKRKMITSFDVGSWSDDWSDAKHIVRAIREGNVDFILASPEEISALTGLPADTAVEKIRRHSTIGLHLGRNGAKIITRSEEWHIPAWDIRPVRVTGAGDTWNAGFIWAFLKTGDLAQSGKIAMDIVERYVMGEDIMPPQ